jgi:hypothetical protein
MAPASLKISIVVALLVRPSKRAPPIGPTFDSFSLVDGAVFIDHSPFLGALKQEKLLSEALLGSQTRD